MPEEGVEPSRACAHGCLRPDRLPISTLRRDVQILVGLRCWRKSIHVDHLRSRRGASDSRYRAASNTSDSCFEYRRIQNGERRGR